MLDWTCFGFNLTTNKKQTASFIVVRNNSKQKSQVYIKNTLGCCELHDFAFQLFNKYLTNT